MSQRKAVMLMHAGGLRSLVATALVLHRSEPSRLTLVHVLDGRPAMSQRAEYVQRQADHYGLRQVQELSAESLYHRPTDQLPDGRPFATLAAARLLLQVLAHAADHAAAELVWPVSVNGDTQATAAAQEQQILCRQLLAVEPATRPEPRPELTLPLLGYHDAQVVELGAGLGVPWEAAWSCLLDGPQQCGSCPACRRRKLAFRAAGVVDPVFAPAGQR